MEKQHHQNHEFLPEYPVRVANLPEYLGRSDLLTDLFALFRPFGPITRVYVATDGVTERCRGFAYVNFADQNDAEAAADQLNGCGYEHLFLSVDVDKPRPRLPPPAYPNKTIPRHSRQPMSKSKPSSNASTKNKSKSEISMNKGKSKSTFLGSKGNGLMAIAPLLCPIDPGGKNVVFSPFSLRAMLSLITAGASAPAAEQLLSFLKSESVDDLNKLSSQLISEVLADDNSNLSGPKISFANGIWIQDDLPLKPSFKRVVDDVYKADISQVNFIFKRHDIAKEVNAWAEKKTNALIRNVIKHDTLHKDCRLILANALYFKAAWEENAFTPSYTKDYDFHLLGGDPVKAPFMKSNWSYHSFRSYDDFKVLRLPYKKGVTQKTRFALYLLLPHAVDGVASLTKRVVSEPRFLNRHLPIDENVDLKKVLIPRFKISFDFKASDILKQFGITLPFKAGGVSKMVDSVEAERLFVAEIYHKSFIEVNKEGTVAAAVSAAEGWSLCDAIPEFDFMADHPFILLIREDVSGTVLFSGHVLDPLKG